MLYGNDADEPCLSDVDVVVDDDIDCFRFLGDKKRRNQGVRLIVNKDKEGKRRAYVRAFYAIHWMIAKRGLSRVRKR